MGRFDLLPDPETLAAGQALFDKSFEELTNRWIAVWCGYLGIDSVFIVVCTFLFIKSAGKELTLLE